MSREQVCNVVAKYFGWKWVGCTIDSAATAANPGTAMFQLGYQTFTIPWELVQVAFLYIGERKTHV